MVCIGRFEDLIYPGIDVDPADSSTEWPNQRAANAKSPLGEGRHRTSDAMTLLPGKTASGFGSTPKKCALKILAYPALELIWIFAFTAGSHCSGTCSKNVLVVEIISILSVACLGFGNYLIPPLLSEIRRFFYRGYFFDSVPLISFPPRLICIVT